MDDEQLDLFSSPRSPLRPAVAATAIRPTLAAGEMDDAALVAAIPQAGMVEGVALAREAGRRRLEAAVDALEAVCMRFTGFGVRGPVIAEQGAALQALAAIGGPRAANAVTRVIIRRAVAGATLAIALDSAVGVGASLPVDRVIELLRHADAAVRTLACGLVRHRESTAALLVELLHDIDGAVRGAAALALGGMGRAEALPALTRLLETAPTIQVIEALGGVADDDALVLLGRAARTRPDLGESVLEVLDGSDRPLAAKIAAGLRRG
jgi:hypothetical protein